MEDSGMSAVSSVAEPQVQARAAGIAYLITIAAGMFAEVYVRGSVRSGDPVATAEHLRQLESLYRLGVLADGVMLISYVVVTAMLYALFKPVNAALSMLAALFSAIGIAMLTSAMAILLLPLVLQGSSIAFEALRVHGATYGLTGLFFGPYCVLIGWLALRSGWLPSWIGWLMMIAGVAFVLDASVELAAPAIARRIPDAVMLISLLAEGALAIWLAVFGVRPTSRRE
ncbi:MAG TPA: DUF4386 domain-containing protein [Sphingomicrobium sp.]|nr:DUF4386 domain-containing protein [Sphingomicrobium sp.]